MEIIQSAFRCCLQCLRPDIPDKESTLLLAKNYVREIELLSQELGLSKSWNFEDFVMMSYLANPNPDIDEETWFALVDVLEKLLRYMNSLDNDILQVTFHPYGNFAFHEDAEYKFAVTSASKSSQIL